MPVHLIPVLDDLPVGDAGDIDHVDLDGAPGARNALEWSARRGQPS
jgi:hypothetical protein